MAKAKYKYTFDELEKQDFEQLDKQLDKLLEEDTFENDNNLDFEEDEEVPD